MDHDNSIVTRRVYCTYIFSPQHWASSFTSLLQYILKVKGISTDNIQQNYKHDNSNIFAFLTLQENSTLQSHTPLKEMTLPRDWAKDSGSSTCGFQSCKVLDSLTTFTFLHDVCKGPRKCCTIKNDKCKLQEFVSQLIHNKCAYNLTSYEMK